MFKYFNPPGAQSQQEHSSCERGWGATNYELRLAGVPCSPLVGHASLRSRIWHRLDRTSYERNACTAHKVAFGFLSSVRLFTFYAMLGPQQNLLTWVCFFRSVYFSNANSYLWRIFCLRCNLIKRTRTISVILCMWKYCFE